MSKMWNGTEWVENNRFVEDPHGEHPEVAAARDEREKAAGEQAEESEEDPREKAAGEQAEESEEDPREKASTKGRAASSARKSTKQ